MLTFSNLLIVFVSSSMPRFGSGATSLNVVTHQQQQQQQAGCRCQELRAENELLKQLVETLTKQHKAAEDKVNLLQVCATLPNMQIIYRATVCQSQLLSPEAGVGSPLSLISEALRSRLGLKSLGVPGPVTGAGQGAGAGPGFNERGIRRVLGQAEPRPVTSTLVTTTRCGQ